MSKKKKVKRDTQADKNLSYGIIGGLSIGIIIGFILLIVTDNMLWMTLPIATLFIGMAIATLISNKQNTTLKSKVKK